MKFLLKFAIFFFMMLVTDLLLVNYLPIVPVIILYIIRALIAVLALKLLSFSEFFKKVYDSNVAVGFIGFLFVVLHFFIPFFQVKIHVYTFLESISLITGCLIISILLVTVLFKMKIELFISWVLTIIIYRLHLFEPIHEAFFIKLDLGIFQGIYVFITVTCLTFIGYKTRGIISKHWAKKPIQTQ